MMNVKGEGVLRCSFANYRLVLFLFFYLLSSGPEKHQLRRAVCKIELIRLQEKEILLRELQ